MKFLVSNIIIYFLFCSSVIVGQDHNKISLKDHSLQKLLSDPSAYTSTQRVEIYETAIMQYAHSNLDTLPILFKEMEAFGRKIKDDYVVGMAINAIAELLKMEGNYEGVVDLLKEVLPLIADYPENVGTTLVSISNAYLITNELDSAEHYISMAKTQTFAIQDTHYFVDIFLVQGYIKSKQGKYYSAIDDFLMALSYGDKAFLPLKKANTLNVIAKIYSRIGDVANALKYCKLSLNIAVENSYKNMTAEMSMNYGGYLEQNGEYNDARHYLEQALSYQESKQDAKNLINTYSKLGYIALKQNDLPTAEKRMVQAQKLLSDDIDDTYKSSYYNALGHLNMYRNRFYDGEIAFKKMLTIVKSIGDEGGKIAPYIGLKDLFSKQGKWKEAYAYGDSILNLNNRLEIENQKKLILDLESKYEAELKESQINALNAKDEVQKLIIEKKNKQLLYFGLGLLLATMTLLGFYKAYRTKTKSNTALNNKNNQLMEALENNKMLVKEIHHRVKNNLQVVSSLLNLQSRFEQDDTVLQAINTGKYRVQSMSLLHQSLYLNEDLNSIHIKKYFEDLAKSIVKGYPLFGKEVKLELDIEDIQLDVDTVVPLGLIANELITNSLKYAYDDIEDCKLDFSIKEADGMIRLIVKDNGQGIKFTELPEKSNSMGMQLIKSFASKIKAKVDIDNFKGTEFKLTFSKKVIKPTLTVIKNEAS